ncbi:hypothetical protein [Cellulosimicrobium sp. NPDC057862]|uniref:hypothetical protein n=1 Tax=Actinomycetes TaxID=1760 RepID=UPI003670D1AA
MSAPLIERVPFGLRDGLEPAAEPVTAQLATRTRRVLTDDEAASLSGAGRYNAQQRAELLAEVGDALLAALEGGVVAP